MNIREQLLTIPAFRHAWAKYRGGRQESRYRGWQRKYSKEAEMRGLRYHPGHIQEEVRERLRNRSLGVRRVGEIHTAIMTMTSNWGIGMVYELQELGKVSVFDNEKLGFSENDPKLPRMVPELNRRFIEFLKQADSEHPLDWILLTCAGNVILKDTLKKIREEMGIPIVNQWLDCKQNFEGGTGPNGQDIGMKDIASGFDILWTSSRSVCEWYMAIGARPIFLPEGFSPKLTPREYRRKKHDVGFLGKRYGLRPDYIQALRKADMAVAARGYGWPTPDGGPVPLVDMARFFAECKVNLGIGGVGYSTDLTTLKGRDFEVPGAGGVYLTTYNSDLAKYFHVGREILCYRSVDEMVEQAKLLVKDETLREEISNRAFERSMREHRWMHRFLVILKLLGIVVENEPGQYGCLVG